MNKGLIYVKLMVAVAAFMAMSSRADVKLDVTNSLVLHLAADNIDAGDANQVRADSGSLYVKKWPGQMSGNAFMAGDISEIMLYNRPLSSPEIESAGTYLSEKYRIITAYWAPPKGAIITTR